jgi:hypothetical protein
MATGTDANALVRGLLSPNLTKPSPIRLRLDLFDRVAIGRGWKSDTDKARGIGVDPSVFGRVRRGEVAPGVRFIACVLHALPEWPFNELFVVDLVSDSEVTE